VSTGPDTRRLTHLGDFNVDLLVTELAEGPNSVLVAAVDRTGAVTTRYITVRRVAGSRWALPAVVDWSTVSSPNAVGQVVDGRHTIVGGRLVMGLGNAGYDRLVAIGDTTWTDVEILTDAVFDGFVASPGPLSGPPGFGIMTRWNGHNDTVAPGSQPQQGYLPDPGGGSPTPFGNIAWYRGGRVGMLDHNAVAVVNGPTSTLTTGATYRMRLRVTTSGTRTTYRFRFWNAAVAEPGTWTVTWTSPGGSNEPRSGSVVLLAHETAVRWGRVTVQPASA
jgi:hypothetical protein